MEESVGIGVHADLGVGSTRLGASETFVVDADVHGLDGANLRVQDVGERHGIEERRSWLAPLVIEQSESVGERSSLLE